MLSVVLVAVVVALMLLRRHLREQRYWSSRGVTRYRGGWAAWRGGRHLDDMCQMMYDKYDAPYVGTHVGATPALVLRDREDIEAVLAGGDHTFHSRGLPACRADVLADNLLFMSDYRRWKLIRQKLSPVFTASNLRDMFYIVEKCARDFVELVEDNCHLRRSPFDVLFTYAAASLGAAVFGIDARAKTSTMDSPVLDVAWAAARPSLRTRIKTFAAAKCPGLADLLGLKIYGEHEDFFVGAVRDALAARRRETERRYDFMELCGELQRHGVMQDFSTGHELEPRAPLLAAQAFVYVLAAAPAARLMHRALQLLAERPHLLRRLHDEIDAVFGAYRDELTSADLERVPYLHMVISETLRLFPPVSVLRRACGRDTVLPRGLRVEAGTLLLVLVRALQRDDRYHARADTFDPDRFSPTGGTRVPKYSYLPFGEGSRSCIGWRLARLQVCAGLCWLLRRFTLRAAAHADSNSDAPEDTHATYDLIVRDI